MKCSIKFINHPKHGPIYYAVAFASKNGFPVMFERRYIIHNILDLPTDEHTTPEAVGEYLAAAIRSSAKRAGVELEDYPDIDKKITKLTSLDIANIALKKLGRFGIGHGKKIS